MRKILVLAVALMLPGCITLQDLGNAVGFATASISNPVTPNMLAELEEGAVAAFSVLGAYKRDCIKGVIPASCQKAIRATQVYTRKIPPILVNLRAFVRNNDQVNAVIAYNTIKNLVIDMKQAAANNGVKV